MPPPASVILRETPSGWRQEMRETFALAWPLVIAQLAAMALNTTDILMMGWLGPEFLAAGALASALYFPFLMFGHGVMTAVAPMLSQALGARQSRSVRRTVRQGLWAALGLAGLMLPLLWQSPAIFAVLGQEAALGALGATYLDFAAFSLAPAFGFVVLRSLIAAHGRTGVVLAISLAGIPVNALANYALMFGNFGFPRLELAGAGIATTLVQSVMFALLMLHVLRQRRLRRYAILARFWRADWPRLGAILRLGAPIGLMMVAETLLFTAAAVLMGWLGADELAGHAVALQLIAIGFMVPLGLSQATTIRVGLAHGAGRVPGVARAGWVSIGLALGFMACLALVFWLAPRPLVHLFLDPGDPANSVPITLAVAYLGIAALFQLVDGAQVTAAAALRGMSDTAVPMAVAIVGYWVIGIPTGYLLAFPAGLGGQGVWLGLAAGLAFAAVVLNLRFALRLRRLGVRGSSQSLW